MRWRDEVRRRIKAERIKFATRLQRRYRVYWGWKSIQTKLYRLRKQEEDALMDTRKLIRRRMGAAIHIQRWVRGHHGRAFARKHSKLIRSCKKVQRKYRVHHSKAIMFFLKAIKMAKTRMALHAQRLYRGHCDRRHVKLLVTLRRMQRERERRLKEKKARLELFRQHGAADYIKEWWRSIQRRIQFRVLVRAHKFKMALRIQRYFRGTYRERRRFLAKKKVQYILRRRLETNRCIQIRKDLHWAAIKKKSDRRNKKKQMREADIQEISYFGGRFKTTVDMSAVRRNRHKLKRAVKLGFFGKKNKLEAAALLVQRNYRAKLARKRIKRMKRNIQKTKNKARLAKRMHAIILVQSLLRGRIMKKRAQMLKFGPAASFIQRHFRRWLNHRRNSTATTLQRYMKGLMQQKKFRALLARLKKYQNIVSKMQACVRGYQARLLVAEKRDKARRWEDLAWCGRAEMKVTQTYWANVLTLRALRRRKKESKSEHIGLFGLEGVFRGFIDKNRRVDTSSSSKTSSSKISSSSSSERFGINGSSWKKMLSQSKNLMDKEKITPTKCDLIFAKHKPKDQRTLIFPQFCAALKEIAALKYPDVISFAGLQAQHVFGQQLNGKIGPSPLGGKLAPISPEEARTIQLINKHLLVFGVQCSKNARNEMTKKVKIDLTWAQEVMCAAWRKYKGKELQGFLRIAKEAWLKQQELNMYAIRIQQLVRTRQARKKRWQVINEIYVKFLDPETGEPYYFSRRTNQKTWHKPPCLRKGYWDYDSSGTAYYVEGEDLDDIFELPTPQREFVVLCSQCEEERVEFLCQECEVPFCAQCFHDVHRSGKRKKHVKVKVDICGECGYQVATRHCIICATVDRKKRGGKSKLCDNCFSNRHKRKKHAWNPIVATCVECEEFAVKWWCQECDDGYCTLCFEKVHAHGRRMLHNAVATPLLLMSIMENKLKVEREKEEAIALAERNALRAQFRLMAMHQAATTFQALYRGKMVRRAERERRRKLRLWERAQQTEQREKEKLEKLTSTKLKNAGLKILNEEKFKKELPGTVTLTRDKRTLLTTVDITNLLEVDDRILVCGRRYTVKRVKKHLSREQLRRKRRDERKRLEEADGTDMIALKNELMSPAERAIKKVREEQAIANREKVLSILLKEKFDGTGDFTNVQPKNIKRDIEGACTRVKGAKAYLLPRHSKTTLAAAKFAGGLRDFVSEKRRQFQSQAGGEGRPSALEKFRRSETGEKLEVLWGKAKETETFKALSDSKTGRVAATVLGEAKKIQAMDIANAAVFLGKAVRGKEDLRGAMNNAFEKFNAIEAIEQWKSLEDKSGRAYYHNFKTGETTWKKPEGDLIRIEPFDKPEKKKLSLSKSLFDLDDDDDDDGVKGKLKSLLKRTRKKKKKKKKKKKDESSTDTDTDEDEDDDGKDEDRGIIKSVKKTTKMGKLLKKMEKTKFERPRPPPRPEGGFSDERSSDSDLTLSDDDQNEIETKLKVENQTQSQGQSEEKEGKQNDSLVEGDIQEGSTDAPYIEEYGENTNTQVYGYETDDGAYNSEIDYGEAYNTDIEFVDGEERRIDEDGAAYTYTEFASIYGENSQEWENAQKA
eukprot:g142.t1